MRALPPAADQLSRVCATARGDQQARVDQQIASSNIVMLADTLAAIVAGMLCAIASAIIVVRPVRWTNDRILSMRCLLKKTRTGNIPIRV
jgi:hypothetical protein